MTKLEELKATRDAAYTAFLKADAAYEIVAMDAYYAELKKSKEQTND